MARGGEVRLEFAGEERVFRLALGQLRSLEDSRLAGCQEILSRIQSGAWRIDDLREVLRLGLEGGGMKPDAAGRLIRQYVDHGLETEGGYAPWDLVQRALAVLVGALSGSSAEPDEAGEGESPPFETPAGDA